MWYIVRLDSSRVATVDKVRSATLVSSDDPTRVKSNYIPVKTTILRQIERCPGNVFNEGQLPREDSVNYINSKLFILPTDQCMALLLMHDSLMGEL